MADTTDMRKDFEKLCLELHEKEEAKEETKEAADDYKMICEYAKYLEKKLFFILPKKYHCCQHHQAVYMRDKFLEGDQRFISKLASMMPESDGEKYPSGFFIMCLMVFKMIPGDAIEEDKCTSYEPHMTKK